jgi:hypothetical protein
MPSEQETASAALHAALRGPLRRALQDAEELLKTPDLEVATHHLWDAVSLAQRFGNKRDKTAFDDPWLEKITSDFQRSLRIIRGIGERFTLPTHLTEIKGEVSYIRLSTRNTASRSEILAVLEKLKNTLALKMGEPAGGKRPVATIRPTHTP